MKQSKQQNPSLSELRARFSAYGLAVVTNVLCPVTLRHKWKYATQPTGSGNMGHGHFSTKKQVAAYLAELDNVAALNDDAAAPGEG